MNCSSFIPALLNPGSGGGGTTNYDQLANRPVQNVSGNPVVISTLPSGVYNIDGSWAITADSKQRATYKDDLFYVLNENGVCKMTWITAGDIYTYSSQNCGDASSDDEGIQNLGKVVGKDGSVYVPHVDAHKVLTFTIETAPGEIPEPVDLNPNDEWVDMGGDGMDSPGNETGYVWEDM